MQWRHRPKAKPAAFGAVCAEEQTQGRRCDGEPVRQSQLQSALRAWSLHKRGASQCRTAADADCACATRYATVTELPCHWAQTAATARVMAAGMSACHYALGEHFNGTHCV